MTIGDCVLDNMSVDYAPNGTWSAYNDGYGIQTRMTLTFKEMSIMTKDNVNNLKVRKNFENAAINQQNAGFATFDSNGKVNSESNPNAWGGA